MFVMDVRLKPLYVIYWGMPGRFKVIRLSRSGQSAWIHLNGKPRCVPLVCLTPAYA